MRIRMFRGDCTRPAFVGFWHCAATGSGSWLINFSRSQGAPLRMGNIFYNVKARAAMRMASSHIAGEEIADALRVCRAAARLGWKITLCPWERPAESVAVMARAY